MVRLNEESDEESDSDNEADDDLFEVCSVQGVEKLFQHQPTFWMGTQNGL